MLLAECHPPGRHGAEHPWFPPPGGAMIEVMRLWLSILPMIPKARRHDGRAAPLVAPDLAALAFSNGLNGVAFRRKARLG